MLRFRKSRNAVRVHLVTLVATVGIATGAAGMAATSFASGPPERLAPARVWLFCDVVRGSEGSNPFDFTTVNGKLFFSSFVGEDLWSSDGTCAGARSVYAFDLRAPRFLTSFSNRVFFAAPSPTQTQLNVELWFSDGTNAGTRLFADIALFYGSNPLFLTVAGDTLFFHAWDPDNQDALWATDGTRAGTRMVGDMYAQELADFQGTLYFAGWTWEHGMELWRSDGTVTGTHLVRDIWQGRQPSNLPNESEPSSLASVNGTLYFAADDGVHGRELWRSDGTAAGTRMVCDRSPGASGLAPRWLAGLGGRVYFAASDAAHGRELWRSDGTCRGTKLVRDIVPGRAGSYPRELTRVAARLFFAATDGAHGAELWVSDGTGAGTKLARDIIPGKVGSDPHSLAAIGRRLFFAADDGTHGKEIWNATP